MSGLSLYAFQFDAPESSILSSFGDVLSQLLLEMASVPWTGRYVWTGRSRQSLEPCLDWCAEWGESINFFSFANASRSSLPLHHLA